MAVAVRYDIEHVSRYRYEHRVRQCVMMLCLEPRGSSGQRLLHFEIETHPAGGLSRETDSFGNARHVLDLHQAHRVLAITSRSTVVSTTPATLPSHLGAGAWNEVRALAESFADWDFTHPSPLIPSTPRSPRSSAAIESSAGTTLSRVSCGSRTRSIAACSTYRAPRRRTPRSTTSSTPTGGYVRTSPT